VLEGISRHSHVVRIILTTTVDKATPVVHPHPTTQAPAGSDITDGSSGRSQAGGKRRDPHRTSQEAISRRATQPHRQQHTTTNNPTRCEYRFLWTSFVELGVAAEGEQCGGDGVAVLVELQVDVQVTASD